MSLTFKDVIEYDKQNHEVYNELVSLQKGSLLVPFIGAGMSVFLGFPTWFRFLNDEYKKLEGFPYGMPKEIDYYEAASYLCYKLSTTIFYNDIRKSFGGEWDKNEWKNQIKRFDGQAIFWLPKLFDGLIITTNFDQVLQHAFQGYTISDPSNQEPLNRALREKRPLIYKIHGDISDSENIILTKESYQKCYASGSALQQVLKRIFMDKILFFIGCSLVNDKTVELWQEIAQPGMEHYAIIPCEKNKQNMCRKQFGEKRIKVILYEKSNHDAIRIILEQLFLDTNEQKAFNNLPKQNPYFTGRKEILEMIYNGFRSNERINLSQTISGLGGIGKTQCALEYAYCKKREYDYIIWINAELSQLIHVSFFAIARNLGLIQKNTMFNDNELQREIKKWYSTHRNILLIFDNVDDEYIIIPYLPPIEVAHVLITSRKMNIYGSHRIDISVFSVDESVEFLIKRTQVEDRDGAVRIAERLGYLALALDQAASYILKTNNTFTEYISLLDKYGLAVFDPNMRLTSNDYKNLITVTWDISFSKIKSESSKQLFNLCSYMASDNIPLDLFTEQHLLLPEPLKSEIVDKLKLERILADLQEYRLIDRKNDNVIGIHRLVQAVVRDKLKEDLSFIQCCIRIMKNALPEKYFDISSRERFSLYAEHVMSVAEYAKILSQNYAE